VSRRILAIVLGLVALAGCTGSDGAGGGGPVSPSPADGTTTGPTGETSAPASLSPSPEPDRLLPEEGQFVALPLDRYTPMWEEPGRGRQPDFAFDTQNPFEQLAPMLIEGATRRDGEAWYEVLLPVRPNGETAWVRGADIRIRERTERIEVDLSRRMLWHYDGDELVDRFRIGVGTEQYPTGTGRFYVWVKVPYDNPNNPYGIMALGLSGFSPVLSDWPGEGRMAVHGTPYASNRGQAVSHGCVRVFNADMESLVDLPLGTPVEIRS
jgi:hypothetical protein